MHQITTSYHIENCSGINVFCCKIHDTSWEISEQSLLFAEVSEGLIESSYNKICFDLSNLSIINSNTFGICFNIIQKAEKCGKKIKFRFNKDVAYVAKTANMQRHAEIEVI